MSPKVIVLVAGGAIGVIRAAHSARRARSVAARHQSPRDQFALGAALAGFIIPIVWALSSLFAFADFRPLRAVVLAGAGIQAAALYLFHRSHVDLGKNWSANVQVFESHELITSGVYAKVRHPMYLSLIVFGLGQAMVVPNWLAGPACLAGSVILYALRVGPEEAMMREQFGREYDAYAARAGRLWPFP